MSKIDLHFASALQVSGFTLFIGHEGPSGEQQYSSTLFSDLGTKRGEELASRPGRFLLPGKTRYSLYRRLGGPQGRSGQVRKISPPPGFDPRTVQPVASHHTELPGPLQVYRVRQNFFCSQFFHEKLCKSSANYIAIKSNCKVNKTETVEIVHFTTTTLNRRITHNFSVLRKSEHLTVVYVQTEQNTSRMSQNIHLTTTNRHATYPSFVTTTSHSTNAAHRLISQQLGSIATYDS
jgi:hypothetical protein